MSSDSMRNDPAFAAMTLDILHNLLSRADNSGRLVDYLTEEIRELTGARCVIFIQCLGDAHRVLGINPGRHLAWAESPERKCLYDITHNLSAAEVWDQAIPSEASRLLQQNGFALSMAIPLNVGAVPVGSMLVLGLPDQQHIASEIKLLTTLATIVALVLRNSFLFENQEEIIAKRTKELTLAAFTLDKSEERFELAMEASSDGIFDWNLKTREIYFSPGWKKMLGYEDDELENEFSVWERLTNPENQARSWEILNEHLQGKTHRYEMEFQMRHKNGHWVDILSRARSIFDDDGTPVRVVGTHTDITERKRAEKEKANLESQLLQAQKMESVGRLAGGVAHDFNNMLGVIIGRTEMLLEDTDPGLPLFEELQEICKAAERSASLTRQLLAFARKQVIAPRVLDVNETVEGMLKLLRRLIGEDIYLAWLPGGDVWPVNMDPAQIDQILANLCVNARDAIGGVGKLTIQTECVVIDEEFGNGHGGSIPGEYVLLAVSDDGCGMDKETMNQLFEPFFTTKELGKGTGLGLATIYGIVKQNNGFINVYSEPGQGTIFRVYLPRHHGETSQEPERPELGEDTRGHQTILLVEDEPTILTMTTTMLTRLGYRVLAASTPGEAIRLAEKKAGEIDLLLTDVVMPGMNGRDLDKHLRSFQPNFKTLFMSGYTADIIAHRGVLDAGVAFIEKPFTKKNLAAKLRGLLE